MSFTAHQKHFRLRLKRDLEVFSDKLEVLDDKGQRVDADPSHIYTGYLIGEWTELILCFFFNEIDFIGEPDSKVFGSIMEGVFEGKIVSPKGSYYVEKAHHYFPHKTHPNRTFHSVIYHEDHVHDPYESVREGK